MMKYSNNKKLNGLLNEIESDLLEMGRDEVARYVAEFPRRVAIDHNIAMYGNVLVYYSDIRELYARNGYKTPARWSDAKLWETYRRQVGYVARAIVRG